MVVSVLLIGNYFIKNHSQNQPLNNDELNQSFLSPLASDQDPALVVQAAITDFSATVAQAGDDLIGVYTGNLPCLDCTGVSTYLMLMTDSTNTSLAGLYTMLQIYDTQPLTQPLLTNGTFTSYQNQLGQSSAQIYQLQDELGYPAWHFKLIAQPSSLRLLSVDAQEIVGNAPLTLQQVEPFSLLDRDV